MSGPELASPRHQPDIGNRKFLLFEFRRRTALSFCGRRYRPFKYTIDTDGTYHSLIVHSICKKLGVIKPVCSSAPQKPTQVCHIAPPTFCMKPNATKPQTTETWTKRKVSAGEALLEHPNTDNVEYEPSTTDGRTNHHCVISTSASPNMLAFLTSNPSVGSASASTSSLCA